MISGGWPLATDERNCWMSRSPSIVLTLTSPSAFLASSRRTWPISSVAPKPITVSLPLSFASGSNDAFDDELSEVPCAHPATSAPEATSGRVVRSARAGISAFSPGPGWEVRRGEPSPTSPAETLLRQKRRYPGGRTSDLTCQDSVVYSVRQPREV